MTENQFQTMVNRFLGWPLPEDFRPDAGISFKPDYNENTAHPMRHRPTGTNLLDASQAEAMLRYVCSYPPGETTSPPLGDYAIVELFGHTTLVGRIAEVERFGAKMLALEPLFRDTLLPVVLHGGAAIYRLTPCSAEVARKRQPRDAWELPTAVRAVVPPLLLEASADSAVVDVDLDDDA